MKPKNLKFLLAISPLILTGCFGEKDPSKNVRNFQPEIAEIDLSYDEVLEYQISYENMFDLEAEKYYVYFYSTTCSNCQEIKNTIIKKALERKDIYFVKSSMEIHIENDVKFTIGAEKIGDFAILGYPTLAKIVEQKCTKNIAGKSQIITELNGLFFKNERVNYVEK